MQKKREIKERVVYKEQRSRLANLSRDAFFIAGLMLYLGEGDKKHTARIGIANTDPRIIKFFIKWVIDFLVVVKIDIKVQLHLYENMDIEQEKKFWQDTLGFQETQFYKIQIRKLQKSSFSYKESYRHGTCSIFLLGTENKRKIMMAIQAFLDEYMEEQ